MYHHTKIIPIYVPQQHQPYHINVHGGDGGNIFKNSEMSKFKDQIKIHFFNLSKSCKGYGGHGGLGGYGGYGQSSGHGHGGSMSHYGSYGHSSGGYHGGY